MKDFKAFILRGNVVDLAVGVIIGSAFGAIINSLVKDIIMPPIGLILSGINFSSLMLVIKHGSPAGPYSDPATAAAAGAVTINYGAFLMTIISFLIIALMVFFLIVRPMTRLTTPKKPAVAPAPTTKECPYCYSSIPIKATRCPNCTSQLEK